MEKGIVLMDYNLFLYLTDLKKLLDEKFAKMEIVTFSYANFQTDMVKHMRLPEDKVEWFLVTIQKMNIVQFILSDGSETMSLGQLGENGQLRFDSKHLSKILQEEEFKRLGV